MTDLFTAAPATAETKAIIERALNAGYSVRIEDRETGENLTRTTRNIADLFNGLTAMNETRLHIIKMTGTRAQNIGAVIIRHEGERDSVKALEHSPNGTQAELEAIANGTDDQTDDQTADTEAAHLMDAPTETVTTCDLIEGDLIRENGCVLRIGPITSRPNDQGHPERGDTRHARGYVVHRSETSSIPIAWLDTDDQGKFWAVQGNRLAQWQRITTKATGQ